MLKRNQIVANVSYWTCHIEPPNLEFARTLSTQYYFCNTFMNFYYSGGENTSYLKTAMKMFFVICVIFAIISALLGRWLSDRMLFRFGALTVVGNLLWAYFFRLWDRRDRERASDE